ncbi:MAG: glycogen synthase [Sphaerochaetaceae bacterium]|nr:glycogen synthase [Sphaerochaetaceae bacterium]
MKIYMVTSEAVPFSKSGGLADVSSSLSIALSEMAEHTVRLIVPLYGLTDRRRYPLTLSPVTCRVQVADEEEEIKFYTTQMKGVEVFFIDHPWFSKRKGIYGDTSYAPYPDNLLRYILMSKAAIALCTATGWIPDVFHCHDWTTGFLPYMIKHESAFMHTTSVFTIHNLAYQGEFPRLDLLLADMKAERTLLSGDSIDARVNMLKAALVHADILTTVSPTYAQEIQEEEQGCHLDRILASKSNRLFGILNGIDTDEWDPKKDSLISHHFSPDDMKGKALCKSDIQKRFNLPVEPETPLIGMISRLAEQKGFYELCQGSPSPLERMITDLGVQILIIGTGDEKIEQKLTSLAQIHTNLSVNLVFSDEAAHAVEAGSDMFLMPSRYEPCGLNQMYSMRYGTIVVARNTGGLADSIIDADMEHGTGFLFNDISGASLYEAVERAVRAYREDRESFETMRIRGMKKDFSWGNSAQEYHKVYTTIVKG